MKYLISIDWNNTYKTVGFLNAYIIDKKRFSPIQDEFFSFKYSDEWLNDGFEISPDLPFQKNFVYESDELPLAFHDMMPDRWGNYY
jgi:hypothetical protein